MITKKQLKLWVCGALVATAMMGSASAVDVLRTADGYGLTMPAGITVFDANDVTTPQGKKAIFTPQMITMANQMYSQLIRQQAVALGKPELANFNGEVVKSMNVSELKGTDAQGHHVAYVMDIETGKDFRVFVNTFDKKTSATYDMKKSREEDLARNQEWVKKAKSPKEYGQLVTAEMQKEMLKNFDQQIARQNVQIAELKAKLAAQGKPTAGLQPITPEQAAMMKHLYTLISVETSQMPVEKVVGSRLGEAVYSEGRMNIVFDGYSFPMSVFSLARYKEHTMSVSAIMMNDSSYDFWKPVIQQVWQVGKEVK